MLYTITQLTGLDIYRDGGSLSLSFLDGAGANCTLMFPINLVASGPRKFEKLGYRTPCVEIFRRTERVSPITGLVSFDTENLTEPVSWEGARNILRQAEPLVAGLESDYAHVYPEMVAIAKNNGHIGRNV